MLIILVNNFLRALGKDPSNCKNLQNLLQNLLQEMPEMHSMSLAAKREQLMQLIFLR